MEGLFGTAWNSPQAHQCEGAATAGKRPSPTMHLRWPSTDPSIHLRRASSVHPIHELASRPAPQVSVAPQLPAIYSARRAMPPPKLWVCLDPTP